MRLKTMILLLALSVSCGESSQKTGNPTLDSILLSRQTLLHCEGTSDAPLTKNQINAMVQDCTPAELQTLEKFAACLVGPICNGNIPDISADCGGQPPASKKCQPALAAAKLL